MKLSIERLPQVKLHTGWSPSTVYERVKQGLFPPQITLSRRSVGWLSHEIDAVLRARMRGAGDEEVKHLVTELIKRREES